MMRNPQLRNPKFYIMIAIDIVLFIIAICSSYLLRFEFSFSNINIEHPFKLLPWMVPLKFIFFYSLGLYKGMWRYTSLRDFWLLAQACFLSTCTVVIIILVMYRFEGYSRAVFIMDGFLTLFLTGGVRLMIRTFYSMRAEKMTTAFSLPDTPATKILIIGAGDAGEKMLREIRDNYRLNYEIVGFVDDDLSKQGKTIHGVHVLGTVDRLPKILLGKSVGHILIAIPSATGEQIRRIVETCQQCNVSYKILPGIGDLIDGRVSV